MQRRRGAGHVGHDTGNWLSACTPTDPHQTYITHTARRLIAAYPIQRCPATHHRTPNAAHPIQRCPATRHHTPNVTHKPAHTHDAQASTFSGPDDVQCKDVYGYSDCDPPLGMQHYAAANSCKTIASTGGITFEDYVKTTPGNLQATCGADPSCSVRISSNPASTICTSNPNCTWVTADMAACLYLGNSWTTPLCTGLASNASAWFQLINCTSCGSPSTAAWGPQSLPFCNSGEASVYIDLLPEDKCVSGAWYSDPAGACLNDYDTVAPYELCQNAVYHPQLHRRRI